MKFFVTGATGFVGTQVVHELLGAGHEVLALARSDTSQAKLAKLGSRVAVIRGELTDIDALKKGASESDGVLHLGFIHDFSNFEKSCQTDREATFAMLDVLEGTNRPFIYTSGTLGLAGIVADETTKRPLEELDLRSATEQLALTYKEKGVRISVIRLPIVHGIGDKAFVPALIRIAASKGISLYVEEGLNSWTGGFVDDVAKLYLLIIEKGQGGHTYHGVAENIQTKDIAIAIGKSLNLPVKSVPKDEAVELLGFIGSKFAQDNQVSSDITRKELGWKPTGPTLLEDIATEYYSKLV